MQSAEYNDSRHDERPISFKKLYTLKHNDDKDKNILYAKRRTITTKEGQ